MTRYAGLAGAIVLGRRLDRVQLFSSRLQRDYFRTDSFPRGHGKDCFRAKELFRASGKSVPDDEIGFLIDRFNWDALSQIEEHEKEIQGGK